MHNALIFLFILLLPLQAITGQEANKFKLSIEAGPLIIAETGGSFALEPKINLSHNSALGFKLGWALISRDLEGLDPDRYVVENTILLSESTNTLALTYDRYFGQTQNNFQPFLGIGLAHYRFGGKYDVYAPDAFSVPDEAPEFLGRDLQFKNRFGLLLRGGFEVGKFRFGADLNLIPENKLTLSTGETIAVLNQSFIGFTLGTTIGGGKWKNSASH